MYTPKRIPAAKRVEIHTAILLTKTLEQQMLRARLKAVTRELQRTRSALTNAENAMKRKPD